MPALPPYLPRTDSGLTGFLANFSSLISANPSQYGLLPSDADVISALNNTWAAAVAPMTSPAQKTAETVGAKNTARITVTAQIRTYAQNVANNPGVNIASKLALALNPKTSTPSPITAPTTFPVLALQGQTPGQVTLRYRDSAASVSVKAKPFGVIACQIFGMVSDTPVTQASALPQVATATKSPFVLDLGDSDIGKTFYAAACWATRTGLVGPFSQIVSFVITN